MATPNKLAKSTPYIGTHDNTFHCDDVTACYILKQLKRFKEHDIVRTRDQSLLDKADIVVDVGSVLDVEKLRLDHHQRSFNQTIKDYHPYIRTTNSVKPPKLSSAGLVYSIFGKEYIMTQLNIDKSYDELDENERRMIDTIFEKAYVEIFEEIDAIDNGVEVASGENLVYNYHINSGISSRVGRYNPVDRDASPERTLEHFKKAMDMVGAEISEGIKLLGFVWWPKRQQFKEFVLKRKKFDPSGQIVHLQGDMLGWKSALFDLEDELGIVDEIKFVIYSEGSRWRCQTLPVNLKSFASRVPLKQDWCGKRDEELQASCGIPDATFVHMSGFTGGANSLEGIKTMVRKTLGLE